MPKKRPSNRLDNLFENIEQEEVAPPQTTGRKPGSPTTPRKTTPRPPKSPTKPGGRASTPAQTSALPPLETLAISQPGTQTSPATLSTALQLDDRTWATLQVVDEGSLRIWEENDEILVRQVTDQLAQALENARLFQETQTRAEELAILNEMGRELTTLLDREEIAACVYKHTSRLMDTTNLFISLYDEKKEEIHPFFVINNHQRVESGKRKLGKGLSDYILRTREALFIPDDMIGNMQRLGIEVMFLANTVDIAKCWMGAPLLAGDAIIGVIGLQSVTTPNLFTERHRDILTAIAGRAAIAIENARLFNETQRRAEELAVLNQLAQRLSARLDVDQVMEDIYAGVARLIDAKNFYIGLYNAERNEVDLPFVATESAIDRSIHTIPASQGFTGHILQTRAPLLVSEDLESVMRQMGIQPLGELAKSWLGVPLLLGEQVMGVMAVQSYTQANVYKEHDRDLLVAFAGQAAIAIQNARLFADSRRRAEELATLNEFGQSLSAEFNFSKIISTAYQGLERLLGAKNFYIAIYDREADEILFPQTITDSELDSSITRLPRGKGITSHMITTGESILISNGTDEWLREKGMETVGEPAKSFLGVPLARGREILGAIAIQDYTRFNAYNNDHLQVLSAFANQISISIQNSRLFEETRQSQEALSRSEGELRALFLAMTDVIIVYNSEGRYIRIAPTNPSRLFRPPQDMLGKTIAEVLPEAMHKQFIQTIQRALESEQLERTEYSLTIEGKVYWFEANVTKLTEDQVFWVARDITERKYAEEALKRRNDYLAATADIAQLVTSTLDLPTLFSRTVNLVGERFGFYSTGIFIIEETGFNAILQASTGEVGQQLKQKEFSLGVGSKSAVGQATGSGRSIIINDALHSDVFLFNEALPETRAEAVIPLRIGSRVIGALDLQSSQSNAFTDEDISVLQILADQVAIAIDNARSYELSIQAVKEMRDADRLKSQFLANMSHELRTPLNSIIGFSRVILKGIDGPISELQQQDLLAIHNSGQHLLGLINDILDLSRIEAGKMELTFDEVHLPELIASVMSTAAGLVKDKAIQLLRDLPADLPTVRADAMRVRQVLLNLLSNASKFTDEGTITVSAVLTENIAGHAEVLVRVTDTGPGISPEDQKKLFQPFSQVDASPTRKTGGSGLGLSISNHLVQMHGGSMGVESDVGAGSTFYFSLPTFHDTKRSAQSSSGNKIILAVDDDPQVISLYERYLKPQGYEVMPLHEPARTLERAQQIKPFAITLDIMMPGYDGWRVLNDLKSHPATRDIPVIVCSIVEEQEKGFSLGAADYLLKPILEEDILGALDRLNSDGSIREVLIVDDDPHALRLIDKMLSEHGRYRPSMAEGGQNGWDAIQSRQPHALILDLFMPDLDGFTILERMRGDQKLRDIPIIVVSGGDLTTEQQEQLREFGQRMIKKGSLTEKELLDTLERALKRVNN